MKKAIVIKAGFTPDISVRDKGNFLGYEVTAISEAGKTFCKAWNKGIIRNTFLIAHSNINVFASRVLSADLVLETISEPE